MSPGMPFWQRIEVRLSLLMVLVVLVTSLVTVALTTYQRVQLFRELPPELRELFRRNEGRLPSISIPPELREMALQGRALWVQVQPSDSPDNPNPIYLMRPADQPDQPPLRIQPLPRRRPNLEARLQQNLLIASLVATGLGVLASLVFARRIAQPIEAISQAASRLAQGQLSARVADGQGQDEVARLARNFNQMAASLEKLEAERRALIADIAHELRTPLTVMQGRLEAIQDGVIPLDRREIDRLHHQTALLSRLVEDLRTLSLADAGRLTLQPRRFELGELLHKVAAGFQPALAAKPMRLSLHLAEEPLWLQADPDRISQIVGNLLANALEHTPAGGEVALIAQVEGPWVWLQVRDHGPGLPSEALERVFDRFYRVETSRSRAMGGSGLGLSIVKTLVELHGGEVRASNHPEGGALFEVRLPLSLKEEA